MKKGKTAVLLVNLGSPDSPKVGDVRRYLTQFLNDPRVIDVPAIWRKILVNLIIVPFRSPKSAKIYQELWTDEGSPLITISKDLQQEVQRSLPDDYEVFLAMRYQNPSLESVLKEIKKGYFQKLLVIPLFPQYASATSGSVIEEVMRIVGKWWVIPELRFISQFYDREDFLKAWIERGKEHNIEEYEHVLFSYHGLPTRQVDKVYEEGLCEDRDCEEEIIRENYYCYKATCYDTTRKIAKALNIPEDKYTVAFQSRLDKNWLEPFSDKVVIEKAKQGIKSLLVFSPAFVADCLETTIEIGVEYEELFHENGGEKLTLVESLNTHPQWVKSLAGMIKEVI
ncbi:MAG: ferrochelatase [Candidatus Cyclobacteriaceae bacterium M2_1C_046]